MARARRIILEGVRDHIVSSLHGKETLFAMWKTLKNLYQNSSDQRKMALKDKLQKIKCEKGNTVTTFLNKLTNCRDELASIGVTTTDDDMEEIRRNTRDGASLSKNDDEENLALASKAKKGKGKASQSKSSQGGKKFDKSKVRCFHCHELGHYATSCPKRKKSKKGSSKESDCDALASEFEMDLSLIACMVSSSMGCVGYLDSGASFHMLGDKTIFSTLEEKDLQIRIEMGDDGKYHVLGEGTVVFQREHGSPLSLSNVMYVLGLKKNLVSIAMLEDKGYDVFFSLGKVFLRHIGTRHTKQIGT
eukprot:PITA_30461